MRLTTLKTIFILVALSTSYVSAQEPQIAYFSPFCLQLHFDHIVITSGWLADFLNHFQGRCSEPQGPVLRLGYNIFYPAAAWVSRLQIVNLYRSRKVETLAGFADGIYIGLLLKITNCAGASRSLIKCRLPSSLVNTFTLPDCP